MNEFRARGLYLLSFLETANFARITNLLLNSFEYRLGRERLLSFPPQMIIDLTNSCNLRCQACPTGMHLPGRRKGIMSLDSFSQIIEQIKNKVMAIHLYNWGEPLLLENFAEYCAIAKHASLVVSTSTNFNVRMDETKAARLIESGLDRLLISLDAVQGSTYEIYRAGGDFRRVIANIAMLVDARKKSKRRSPVLEIIFVRHRDNAAEAEYIPRLCRKLLVDSYRVIDLLLPMGYRLNRELKERWIAQDRLSHSSTALEIPRNQLGKRCKHLWQLPVINWDKTISPCCFVHGENSDFSNLNENDFMSAWNSDSFISARRLFGDVIESKIFLACSHCELVDSFKSR